MDAERHRGLSDATPRLAIVVPTLNEAACLPHLLGDLADIDLPHEVIVADGGSRDGTVRIAEAAGAHIVRSQRGRGAQLRAGADRATAPWLFFVHADSRVPPAARRALTRFLEEAGPDRFATFAFRLSGDDAFWRFVEFGQKIRERVLGLVYGDQGLVVSTQLYGRAGGHPDWRIFEDVEVLDRLKRRGRWARLDADVVTSPRRYEREGRWSGWIRNVGLISLFRIGVPAERLASWYQPHGPDKRREQEVVIFARAPRLGQVKTRLARDLGEAEALRIYRTLGLRSVDAARDSGRMAVVYHTPADAEAASDIGDWLGRDGTVLRPQVEGDLGERMSAAFQECLSEAGYVCLIGTDVPGLCQEIIDRAFDQLSSADVVVGPATDGGYYLIGMKRPHVDLFRDVPWSTARVLSLTLERAAEAGLRVARLPTLADVDVADDVPAELGLT